jgi:hypothetical protein
MQGFWEYTKKKSKLSAESSRRAAVCDSSATIVEADKYNGDIHNS